MTDREVVVKAEEVSNAKAESAARHAPNAFGLFALALALINGLETITNVNIGKYLIQKKEIEPELVGCAWLMGIGQVVRCPLSVVSCL